MEISEPIRAELVAHACAEEPNECCGVVGALNGRATRFYPARNKFESPMRFEIHPADLLRIYQQTEEREEQMVLFHSHPKTEAVPSQTDINLARAWPGHMWLICSLAGDEPVLRGFRIDDGTVEEVELVGG